MESLPGNGPGAGARNTEKQELLSRLLGRLAHEIRNPLSSLHIHVQLLQEDVTRSTPSARELFGRRFEIIHGELSRLESIVRQFLSLSGPATVNPEDVDVGQIAGSVCALLQPEAAAREITLVNECGTGVVLRVDRVQLSQALLNLVINGIQALPEGGTVTVRARVEEEKGRATIEVKDTGKGIDREMMDAIFEPFFTTKAEGSGLGLWIVQQIVSAHGGSVSAQNAAGGGALFIIELPANAA